MLNAYHHLGQDMEQAMESPWIDLQTAEPCHQIAIQPWGDFNLGEIAIQPWGDCYSTLGRFCYSTLWSCVHCQPGSSIDAERLLNRC